MIIDEMGLPESATAEATTWTGVVTVELFAGDVMLTPAKAESVNRQKNQIPRILRKLTSEWVTESGRLAITTLEGRAATHNQPNHGGKTVLEGYYLGGLRFLAEFSSKKGRRFRTPFYS